MYSEMLADGMVPGAAQRQTYLETLKNESGRLAALVENVLAYARLEDGRAPVRPQPIALNDLLDRVLPSLDRRAADAGLALVVSESVRQPTTVLVDGDAVAQILFNLVDNACKYARNGAQPTIELACTSLDRAVLLRVRDHGPGISGSAAARIFEPFERADRNNDPTPGVGLGLALARGLARDLGGDLTFAPGDGGGACFELRLPKT
jgi:signal transduction histidine kinase